MATCLSGDDLFSNLFTANLLENSPVEEVIHQWKNFFKHLRFDENNARSLVSSFFHTPCI